MKLILSSLLLLNIAFAGGTPSVATTQKIDIKKFIGKWFAISTLPQRFSRNCLGQIAEYDIINETKISVKNTCVKEGKDRDILGSATVINPVTNSELIVRFNTWWARLFNIKGDYNIIKIDENYDYLIVGSNDRKSLWIMSRRPQMNQEKYDEYVEVVRKLDYDISKLVLQKY